MTVNEIENISETRMEKEGREGEGEGEEQEEQCESINQGASFSLVWSSGIDLFKRIIKTLGKLEGEGEITFKVTKDGLFYRQMDRSHVSLIDLYLSSEDFESFQCMREGKFTIRSEDLLSRLDRAGREDLLELSSSSSSSSIENSDSLNIILKGRRTTKSFSLNLTMDSPKSDTPLPKLSFESSFQIQAKDLIEVLKDIETTNNHFTLKATNGRQQVVFFAKGDLGTVKDELTHLEINTSVEEQHQGQQITEKETIATYSIQYLSDFLNTLKPESIKVEFSTNMPLRLTVQPLKEGSSKSILQFYLAPRIDEI
jgi:proliferating cell nuclear antigen PCNA